MRHLIPTSDNEGGTGRRRSKEAGYQDFLDATLVHKDGQRY